MKNTTFGSSKAAIDLARILSDNKKYSRKVSSLLTTFNKRLSLLQNINDKKFKLCLMILIKSAALELVESYPDEIKRFTKNVLIANYRNELKK